MANLSPGALRYLRYRKILDAQRRGAVRERSWDGLGGASGSAVPAPPVLRSNPHVRSLGDGARWRHFGGYDE